MTTAVERVKAVLRVVPNAGLDTAVDNAYRSERRIENDDALAADLRAILEERERWEKALQFYAQPTSWSIDGTFSEADETGFRADAGRRARSALTGEGERG